MKTIALFGGTGRTGLPFLKEALNDFKVKALIRNPSKVDFEHENLELVVGDITNALDIRKTIDGSDIVVSLIGHNKLSKQGFQTKAIDEIIKVMRSNEIKRLISLTGGGVNTDGDKPKFMDNLIVFIMKNLAGKMSRNALMDGINHAELIMDSGLDWTIVRGPMLTEEPAKGKIEVGNVGTISGFKLTREDLAVFIMNVIKKNTHIHELPFLSNGK